VECKKSAWRSFAHDRCERNIKIYIRLRENVGGEMEYRWYRISRRLHIFYGKGNENHELVTASLSVYEIHVS
jgi:hypothetical protein